MKFKLTIEFEAPCEDADEFLSCVEVQLVEMRRKGFPFATTGEDEPITITDWANPQKSDGIRWFGWDELGGEINPTEMSREELDELNQEGGWQLIEILPNGVRVLETERHFSLEVRAESRGAAREKMMEHPKFREYQDDNNAEGGRDEQ